MGETHVAAHALDARISFELAGDEHVAGRGPHVESAEGPVERDVARGGDDLDLAGRGDPSLHTKRLFESPQEPHERLASVLDDEAIADQFDARRIDELLRAVQPDGRLIAVHGLDFDSASWQLD